MSIDHIKKANAIFAARFVTIKRIYMSKKKKVSNVDADKDIKEEVKYKGLHKDTETASAEVEQTKKEK